MTDTPFLDAVALALRWGVEPSTIYGSKPEHLPARFVRPGSRLVLYPIHEVEAFERVHTEARDYEVERKLGAAPVLGRLDRGRARGAGGRS